MGKFTIEEKRNGELAVRELSEKAKKLYDETDPIAVYEYDTEGGKRYAYAGCLGDVEELTFEELEKTLESLYDSM